MIWFLIILIVVILLCAIMHFSNPYTLYTFFKPPFTARVVDGKMQYKKNTELTVLTDPISGFFGYVIQGYRIVENNLFGSKKLPGTTYDEIVDEIHKRRFDNTKPYLISGDQFNVFYPRNLGVFYNRLLSPQTKRSEAEWTARQEIYFQSVLFGIEVMSKGKRVKSTYVPLLPNVVIATDVHPGSLASDALYGLLYAIRLLAGDPVTAEATQAILAEKHTELVTMIQTYMKTVRDSETGMVFTNIELSSARDGVIRQGSFYDNVILWSTLKLATELAIYPTGQEVLDKLKADIHSKFWLDISGHYKNDTDDASFSADWLIGYVTDFFNLSDPTDLARTLETIRFVESSRLGDPLPLAYENGDAKQMPTIIRLLLPTYGSENIWSYWGSEYITLLVRIAQRTNNPVLVERSENYLKRYEDVVVRDRGFPETFNEKGEFLQTPFYKSIRATGWVVQYEYARAIAWQMRNYYSATTAIEEMKQPEASPSATVSEQNLPEPAEYSNPQ